jgi:hypothetical protein
MNDDGGLALDRVDREHMVTWETRRILTMINYLIMPLETHHSVVFPTCPFPSFPLSPPFPAPVGHVMMGSFKPGEKFTIN